MKTNNKKPNKSKKINNPQKALKKNNQEKNIKDSNNYFTFGSDKKEELENDRKIKEIEQQIKLKREEEIKKFDNPRNKELLKLEIKVLRKLYGDLFIRIPNTFIENNLTFENFVYEFGKEIHSLFEFDKLNPSYDNLLREVNILVLKKYPISPDLTKFNRKELKKYFYDLGVNDDWGLVERYKAEMDQKEEKERLMKIAQSMKDYYKSLDEQIEEKKNFVKMEEKKKEEEKNKKRQELEKKKLMNQKKIEQLQKNEKLLEMLDKKKVEQIQENEKIKQYYLQNLEEENKNMNENNSELIKFKLDNAMQIQNLQMNNYNQKFVYQPKLALNTGYSLPEEQISSMVDEIMNKKKDKKSFNLDNIEDMMNTDNLKEDENVINNNNINRNEELKEYRKIDGINLVIEDKVNKILAKKNFKK